MTADRRSELLGLIDPILATLDDLALTDPGAAEATLAARYPMEGDAVQAIRAVMEEGLAEGWLVPREAAGMRFGRLAKDRSGFSIDVVWSSGSGPEHRHPRGEVNLLFALDGSPRFDGRAPGWAVFSPDSVHVPRVDDGTMLILYILPEGAVEWLPARD